MIRRSAAPSTHPDTASSLALSILCAGTMLLASLAALFPAAACGGENAPHPVEQAYISTVLRGGEEAVRLDIDVEGWRDLWLIVDDVDNNSHDTANWADAKLLRADGSSVYLDELEPRILRHDWGSLRTGSSVVGGDLSIAGKRYERGLGTHAVSILHYELAEPFERFQAWLGVDSSREEGQGSLRFIVSPASIPHRSLPPRGWAAQLLHDLAEKPLRLAIADMSASFGERYPQGQSYLERLEQIRTRLANWARGSGPTPGIEEIEETAAELRGLRREALLANPLLDFDRLLLLRRGFPDAAQSRKAMGPALGMPQNWQANSVLPRRGRWQDELLLLSDLRGEPKSRSIYRPEHSRTISDPVLDFDAKHLLFTMEGERESNFRIFELGLEDGELKQLTPDDGADVAHMDACYLPNGRIIFTSTAAFMGLPCVFGGNDMVCLYQLDRESGGVRQISFDQDSSWSPTPLPNGRILYQRWEYSDIAHSNSRLLMHMNPDGTDQREYWGSGSYFPASFFYARPVPGHPRMVVGIASGHHGTARSGRLLLVDPARGHREAEGVVQEIPGRGKQVEPIVKDRLVDGVWPQFLQPYPLSEKYHLVSAKLGPNELWGIYLVDVFDNMTLIHDSEGDALLWPIPLQAGERPPLIPQRIDTDDPEGRVMIVDVYEGDGLQGIPRGTVKSLRIFEYYFSYRRVGGLIGSLGMDGPWDIRRVLGTVPVEEDGSAYFTVPANTPISIQPLDAEGRALQLMRSWTVVQPGEQASCVGCHELPNHSPPTQAMPLALRNPPARLDPGWHAPARGFSFERDVQPVLDRHCIGCHTGAADRPYLKGDRRIEDWSSQYAGRAPGWAGGRFTESYAQLHRFVRRPGIESDLRMLSPMDYHFGSTELGQMLRKGHHGVDLDKESWDRLVTWVDLNAPFHGTWREVVDARPAVVADLLRTQERAQELRRQYAPHNIRDYEEIPAPPEFDSSFVAAAPVPPAAEPPVLDGWPIAAEDARRMQMEQAGGEPLLRIELGEGPLFPTAYIGSDDIRPAVESGMLQLELQLIPGGRFAMGSNRGHPDEQPVTAVEVEPFLMSRFEISNAIYRLFDPEHESRDESRHSYQFGRRGFHQDAPEQPAVRVSWEEARAFCQWLSEKTGMEFDLPTEAQWEWAARAGNATEFHFGDAESDYSEFANLADRSLASFAQCTAAGHYTQSRILPNPSRYDDWIPRCDRFEDGGLVTVPVGSYKPNPWGLHDMIGNAAEWTRSRYLPYPYRSDDGRNQLDARLGERVARGGSWRDRPHQSSASYRRPYPTYQRVYNVGFRVVARPANAIP
jgi:formylglycine-generating enzyme required for sulfatase activity